MLNAHEMARQFRASVYDRVALRSRSYSLPGRIADRASRDILTGLIVANQLPEVPSADY